MAARERVFKVSEAHLQENNCFYCGHVFPTDLFTSRHSFYCPNPDCQVPHVCIYRDYPELYITDHRYVFCYNCTNKFVLPPPSPASATAITTYPGPPRLVCPYCLIRYWDCRHRDPTPPVDLSPSNTNNNNRSVAVQRPTPALRSFIDSLPVKLLRLTNYNSDELSTCCCSICMDKFFEEDRIYTCSRSNSISFVIVNELPCGHCFHVDCIVHWLHRNHTCPLCRYECPLAATTTITTPIATYLN